MPKECCVALKVCAEYDEASLLRHFAGLPGVAILDSSLRSEDIGRYTIVGFEPFLTFEAKGFEVRIAGSAAERSCDTALFAHPLEELRRLLASFGECPNDTGLPFAGGCIGYLAYEVGFLIEPESLHQRDLGASGVPDIHLGFYNRAIVIDHTDGCIYAVGASVGALGSADCDARVSAQARAQANAEGARAVLQGAVVKRTDSGRPASEVGRGGGSEAGGIGGDVGELRRVAGAAAGPGGGGGLDSNFSEAEYIEALDRVHEYIGMGEVYQVNMSQRFETRVTKSPIDLYMSLRHLSPAPFAAYLDCGQGEANVKVLSSSPERYLQLRGRRAETRPIKGTRPRGRDAAEDQALREELEHSEKDHAELTMIVDLERNDLGRVCDMGSVNVERHAATEAYANVFHLVSTVAGRLREGLTIVDCIYATFPGGSITGAPKIRSMQVIEELERSRRGVYTGAIGYIGFDGDADLNIAIRTIVIQGEKASYSVGGGIVWDSDGELEYEETLHKGRMMAAVLRQGAPKGGGSGVER